MTPYAPPTVATRTCSGCRLPGSTTAATPPTHWTPYDRHDDAAQGVDRPRSARRSRPFVAHGPVSFRTLSGADDHRRHLSVGVAVRAQDADRRARVRQPDGPHRSNRALH